MISQYQSLMHCLSGQGPNGKVIIHYFFIKWLNNGACVFNSIRAYTIKINIFHSNEMKRRYEILLYLFNERN